MPSAVLFVMGILYLCLAVLTFFRPYLILRAIHLLEIRWSQDQGLFSNSKTIRVSIGLLFLLAALALVHSAYVLIFQ